MSNVDIARVAGIISQITNVYSRKIVGQDILKTSLLVALISEGHILLESLPGLAKTTAAHTLAQTIHADFKRIQCTPDLLPSDIIGSQIYDHDSKQFITVKGPVHSNFVLLDEINRSSAKTQSAMLEAMQERQTTIAGTNYPLPRPFMVIATQNPIEQEGTYRLPEAQLDRFLLKEVLEYPSADEELEIIKRSDSGMLDFDITAAVSLEDILWLQQEVKKVKVAESVYRFIVNIVDSTRNVGRVLGPDYASFIEFGASPRASLAFIKASKALALLYGRDYVIPDDIVNLRWAVLRHRMQTTYEAVTKNITVEHLIDKIFQANPAP